VLARVGMGLLWALLAMAAFANGLPTRGLRQVEPDVVWPKAGVVSKFMKTVYAEINSADTKSLAARFGPEFYALCEAQGVERVSSEIAVLYEMRTNDLELALDNMKKMSLLFQRLFASEGDDSSG
jgi:hypothetical protein